MSDKDLHTVAKSYICSQPFQAVLARNFEATFKAGQRVTFLQFFTVLDEE